MDLFQKCQDYTIVKEVMDAGLYPYFHALQSGQDTVVTMEGHRTIMIGSNNYLGLTSDPRVIEAAVEAVKKYGSGCSGSRFLNGTLDIHLELERQLAEFLHVKKIAFEKNSYAQKIHKFNHGYLVQVNYADTPVRTEKDAHGSSVIFPEEISRCVLRVYDENLNLKKETDISSELPGDLWGPIPQSAVSEDGGKVVWAFSRKLYICEVSSDKIEKIFDDDGSDVYFSQVCFTKDSKNIVFTGSSTQTEEGDCVFGLIRLEDKEMSRYVEKQYHPYFIRVTDGYAWLCDTEKPFVGTSGGKVPIVDLRTKKAFTIKVDGAESAHARVSEDGKYLITIQKTTPGNYRIRQYRLPSGEMVNEKSIASDAGDLWNADIVYSGIASSYELTGIAEDGKYASYPFVVEDR